MNCPICEKEVPPQRGRCGKCGCFVPVQLQQAKPEAKRINPARLHILKVIAVAAERRNGWEQQFAGLMGLHGITISDVEAYMGMEATTAA